MARRGRRKGLVWAHFEEVLPRRNPNADSTAACKYCGKVTCGKPKRNMIPHLLQCSQAPLQVKQRWRQGLQNSTVATTITDNPLPGGERAAPTEMGSLSVTPTPAARASDAPPAEPESSPTQKERLELLKLKAKVAQYQARAMGAQLEAETLAARIKLQQDGVPNNEIE
ncbi:hypothetical protein PHYSODRAFT_337717 [Phytophthora sojae]|uniref:BED-type domain-containing protein n=1 Tax=Phytophthora sojae (strain P6497) TaxID=1094619 RepID=G5A203_PHYSP|nr:hypothetical protein PHYSODRAFT_337717 [Phytophthora sojae]EGZ10951.1 hypothetical protein PHYSODRAFT_337717 [Phytophthora sojae]|eukprot:XP_009533696.1 hypothetical protein PHYSODRAFT_337717 [Phytophthora sojae]